MNVRVLKCLVPVFSAAVVTMVTATVASAAELKPFEAKTFEAARQAGTPIVVDISASWCPTCAAQKPIIERLSSKPAFSSMIVFEVDFDGQKDVVRALGAQSQSTLIAFRGQSETARSVGDTDAASIEALFRSTLKN